MSQPSSRFDSVDSVKNYNLAHNLDYGTESEKIDLKKHRNFLGETNLGFQTMKSTKKKI